MKINLAVIGGGSVNWMRGLMKDVYMLKGVEGGSIRLVDPNTEYVNSVAAMLKKFNELSDKYFEISVCESRKDALSGCDFVLTTFSPGAMDAFFNDLEIPIKYGIRMPVSMTCGVSGISAAIRTIPVAYEISEEMEKYCPGAVLLNVTNPMTSVTKAFNLPAKTIKVYGICHEVHAIEVFLGHIFGLWRPEGMSINEYMFNWLSKQGFEYDVAGINHFIWLTKAVYNGKDVIDDIHKFAMEHKTLDYMNIGSQATNSYFNKCEAKLALCRQLGYLPIPGDRHLVEFYSSMCNQQNGYAMKYGVLKTTVDNRRLDKIWQHNYINSIANGATPVSWDSSGEEISDIMQAYIDKTELITVANMPNQGQIANLPLGSVVETKVKKNTDGSITPINAGSLPQSVYALCSLHTTINDMVVTAALNGDRNLLVTAMSLDPSTCIADFSQIPDMAEDLLNANKKWLPRFFN